MPSWSEVLGDESSNCLVCQGVIVCFSVAERVEPLVIELNMVSLGSRR
jgi:hypothetical protein